MKKTLVRAAVAATLVVAAVTSGLPVALADHGRSVPPSEDGCFDILDGPAPSYLWEKNSDPEVPGSPAQPGNGGFVTVDLVLEAGCPKVDVVYAASVYAEGVNGARLGVALAYTERHGIGQDTIKILAPVNAYSGRCVQVDVQVIVDGQVPDTASSDQPVCGGGAPAGSMRG